MSAGVFLDDIRHCLDSGVPCTLATCEADGTPNVAFISHMEYVDSRHVALTYQFFNKTRENILAHPGALAYATDSDTGASYRLKLHYQRTETEGPLFERLRARLSGIASHTGMSGVFRLRGADLYRVLEIEAVAGIAPLPPPWRRNMLTALRRASARLGACDGFEPLLDAAVQALREDFGVDHAMLLMRAPGGSFYTVASCGYEASGVGSEIALGEGVIGVAAQQRVPICISYMTSEYAYSRTAGDGLALPAATEIPFPGLAQAHSQLAVPILDGAAVQGVLYVESPQPRRYNYDDEDALVAFAAQLGLAIRRHQEDAEEDGEAPAEAPPPVHGQSVCIKRYAENDSVFIDDSYLIKGVAGAIIWKLLADHARDGRSEFSNRELRLDPALRLPDVADNLEARLALLNRRLAERCDFLRLSKTGRGRFRLEVQRPVRLVDVPKGAA